MTWTRGIAFAGGMLPVLAAGGVLLCHALAAAGPADRTRVAGLEAIIPRLKPLHRPLEEPKPGDWLHEHREPGQTFRQYVDSRPVVADAKRKVIYIQPLGKFSAAQRKTVKLTADFMGRWFQLPVKVRKDVPLSAIPSSARRVHPSWGDRQILTTYVLDKVLKPDLPADAFACIAFTTSDLWPGPGWNFVFGQASLRERVGVWSIYRNSDADAGEAAFRLCLIQTLKTAVHETGHMASMLHCTRYECCMCGSNHRAESDRRPLWLCPECVAKVCWAFKADPIERYQKLAAFCREHGLRTEADFYSRSVRALGGEVPPAPTTQIAE